MLEKLAATSGPPLTGKGELIDLLLDTAYYVELMGETALADTPPSLLSSRTLATVLDEPGITVAEISRRIPKTQQMISHVTAQLIELGLIERRLGSGRGVGLYVTGAGRQMADEGRAREHEMQMRLRELLSETRYERSSSRRGRHLLSPGRVYPAGGAR